MYPLRGIPRMFIVAMFILLSLTLLLISPFSGHAGRTSRSFVSSVVSKVQNGEIGRLRGGGTSMTEEEAAMRLLGASGKYGKILISREWEFSRAVHFGGTGARIQNFIDKARVGRPFTVSVIGGSVSKGRGLKPVTTTHVQALRQMSPVDDEDSVVEEETNSTAAPRLGADTLYSPENLHVLIFDWLNATFPHPDNRLINGAQGGVGSGYFSWCFKEHISEESDLVLVELGINDLIEVEVLGSYEHLIRGVLELPNTPAVINIETFTTLFPTLLSSSALHLDVAAFYDIPSISVRDVLLPRILGDPDTQMPRWFRTGPSVIMGDSKVREWGGVPVDLMHIEKTKPTGAFAALGRLAPGTVRKSSLRITDLPAAALTMPFDPDTGLIRHDPTCRSMNSGVRHSIEGFHDEGETGIVLNGNSHGWSTWAWKEKIYLVANQPGSAFDWPFTVTEPPAYVPSDTSDTEERIPGHSRIGGKLGFEPLPLAMRPNAPYNVQPMGVVIGQMDKRRLADAEADETDETKEVDQQDTHAAIPRKSKRQYPEAEDFVDGARVMIGFQRSAVLGLGSVFCWVDNDTASGRRVEGWWEIEERNMGMVEEVAAGIQPGAHVLHCELLEHTLDPTGGTEFRIFSIMHD